MPKIFRIRYIPFETVDISSDKILYRDEDVLVTSWKPIKPRKDIDHGASCVFLKEGIKISRFMDSNNDIAFWYIDLIDIQYDKNEDTYYLKDLLIDVKIHSDGSIEIVDLDELADAIEQSLVTKNQSILVMRILHRLLLDIKTGKQPDLASRTIIQAENQSFSS